MSGAAVAKNRKKLVRLLYLAGMFTFAIVFLIISGYQKKNIAKVNKELERKTEIARELSIEEHRLRLLYEYSNSEEYLFDYARNNFGYSSMQEIRLMSK